MSKELKWNDELVAKFWDEVANSHLDSLSFAKVAGQQLFNLISVQLSLQNTILDFGAGSGDFTEILLKNGYRVAVYEPSVKRKDVLLTRLSKYNNFLGVVDKVGAAQFDTVLVLEVIEHILDDVFDKTVDDIVNFLKPHGKLIVTTPYKEDIINHRVYCPVSDVFFHPWQHVRNFDKSQMIGLFNQHKVNCLDFQVVDFSNYTKVYNKLNELQTFYGDLQTAIFATRSNSLRLLKKKLFFWLFPDVLDVKNKLQTLDKIVADLIELKVIVGRGDCIIYIGEKNG